MANYSVYTCTVCKKDQTIKNSSTNVIVNHCLATENCLGQILKTGEADTPIFNSYTKTSAISSSVAEPRYFLTNSESGIYTLGLKISEPEYINLSSVFVKFVREKNAQQIKRKYFFNTTSLTTSISGKDLAGNQLKIDPTFTSEKINIIINGVELPTSSYDLPWTANLIKFTSEIPPSSSVEIVISQLTEYEYFTLEFESSYASQVIYSAWSNVQTVDRYGEKFRLYNNANLNLQLSSTLKIVGLYDSDGTEILYDCIWFLSDYPFSHYERRLDIYVDNLSLKSDFGLKTSSSGAVYISVLKDKIKEVYPLMSIPAEGLITPDEDASSSKDDVNIFSVYKTSSILSST